MNSSKIAILGQLLIEKKITVAVAESCTGGLITHKLTNVSGASAYISGCIVAYSDEVKIKELFVLPQILKQHGAVSFEVACAMAIGVREKFGTTYGLSTTGIAGPTGGTLKKPVGTVWIGIADEKGVSARKYIFGKADHTSCDPIKMRLRNKEQSARAALDAFAIAVKLLLLLVTLS